MWSNRLLQKIRDVYRCDPQIDQESRIPISMMQLLSLSSYQPDIYQRVTYVQLLTPSNLCASPATWIGPHLPTYCSSLGIT